MSECQFMVITVRDNILHIKTKRIPVVLIRVSKFASKGRKS